MKHLLFALCVSGTALAALAQVPLPEGEALKAAYAHEDRDWGVAPPATARQAPVHAPTPLSIPGGRVVRTLELKALLEQRPEVLVIDVLDTRTRQTVPGAYWISGAGHPAFYAAEASRFAAALQQLTGGDKTRPLVFLCASSECWLSYNAALRAIQAGYRDVLWYRGGTDAWKGASLELKRPTAVPW